MFQIQVRHEGKPSITHRIINNFNTFLSYLHEADPSMPGSLAALRSDGGIILQLTGREDPAGVGFKPWRVAFYVIGNMEDVQNALALLDSFIEFRTAHTPEDEPPMPRLEMQVCAHKDIVDKIEIGGFTHKTTLQSPRCFDPFEAAPPAGLKVLVFSAEFDSDGWHMSGCFLGQTYPFRDGFESNGILGARVEETEEYVRVFPRTDVGHEAGRIFFFTTVLSGIVHDLVMQLRLTVPPPADSPAAEFLSALQSLPQVSVKQDT